MTQLAISTAYARSETSGTAGSTGAAGTATLAQLSRASRTALEQRLQRYIATQPGWTLGTLLAAAALALTVAMSPTRTLGDVLFGRADLTR